MHTVSYLQVAAFLAAAFLLPTGTIIIGLSLRGRRSESPAEIAQAAKVPALESTSVTKTENAVTARNILADPVGAGRGSRRPLQQPAAETNTAPQVGPAPPPSVALPRSGWPTSRLRPIEAAAPDTEETEQLADLHENEPAGDPPALRRAVRRALSAKPAEPAEPAGDGPGQRKAGRRGETDKGRAETGDRGKLGGEHRPIERSGEIVADHVGSALVIRSADEAMDARLRALAHAAPDDPTTLTVVVGPTLDAGEILPHLRRAVDAVRDQEYTVIRLVMPDIGRVSGTHGSTATAQDIANSLWMDVLAPEGSVIPVSGGSFFAVAASGGPGGWRRFRHRGRTAETLGPRQPAPRWQSLLGTMPSGAHGDLSVHPVPAGLLLLPKAATRLQPGDPAYLVPVDYSRLHVLAGRLGDLEIGDEEIAAVLAWLPAELRHTARLVPFGPEPSRPIPRGQAVADLLEAEVRALTGVPIVASGRLRFSVLTSGMTPAWDPFAVSLTYRPTHTGKPPSVDHWRAPIPGLTEIGPRVYKLTADWAVEVVPCGLWIHENVSTPTTAARAIPFDPAGPTMVVGTPGIELPEDVWTHVFTCMDRMSGDGETTRLLLVLGSLTDTGQAAAHEVARQHDVELETSRLSRLTRRTPPSAPDETGDLASFSSPLLPSPPVPWSLPEVPVPDPELTGLTAAPSSDEPATAAGRPLVVEEPSVPLPATPHTSAPAPIRAEPTRAQPATPEPAAVPTSEPTVIEQPVEPLPMVPLGAAGDPPPVLPGHRSTEEERERFRYALGDLYSTHLGALSALLAKVPALRTNDGDAAKVDFLAVRTYLSDHGLPVGRTHLNAALRGADRRDAAILAYAACMASGLRRLPSFRGVALRGADLSSRELALYRPGTVLTEWGFTDASTSATAEFGTNAEYLIWCATGRRTAILADDPDDQGLLFPPNTRFLVLGVRRVPGGVVRVLLRDAVRPTQQAVSALSTWTPEPRDEAAIGRLTAAADKRDALDPGARQPQSDDRGAGFPLGIGAAPEA